MANLLQTEGAQQLLAPRASSAAWSSPSTVCSASRALRWRVFGDAMGVSLLVALAGAT